MVGAGGGETAGEGQEGGGSYIEKHKTQRERLREEVSK